MTDKLPDLTVILAAAAKLEGTLREIADQRATFGKIIR